MQPIIEAVVEFAVAMMPVVLCIIVYLIIELKKTQKTN